jgi:histidine triad (HIT) family protein
MEDCLFCKIADKKIPASVIYEDDNAIAFLDIAPRAEGHALVIPKRHSATLTDLPESEVGPLFRAVKSVAELLMNRLGADGLTIGINHGAASGQVVGHLHINILPRFEGDGGGAIQSVVHNPPANSLEDVRKKIIG